MILAHPFERTMKKIVGIAPLIIALILGTCFSSQAQIVTVQPISLDGGLSMFSNRPINGLDKTTDYQTQNTLKTSTTKNSDILQFPDLLIENEFYIIEYELKYSLSSYCKNKLTNLKSGSYYCKLVGCKQNTE